MQNKKVLIGIVVAVVVILGIIVSLPKKDTTAPSETAVEETTATPDASEATSEAAVTTETESTTTKSEDGIYNAECIVSGGGTLLGRIEIDEDETPESQKTISIKNMNTGKSTDVTMADARCTFTPVNE